MVRRLKVRTSLRIDWASAAFPSECWSPWKSPIPTEEKAIHAALRQYTKLRSDERPITPRRLPPNSC